LSKAIDTLLILVYIVIYTKILEIDMANQTEAECLVVASEECAELTKVCMKILRFGIDDAKKSDLISEMGDVQCMIDLLGDHLDISRDQILEAASAKREKLKKWSNLIK
tara:strand:- start:434 stop:760 length:327 start_codon:yes stop_codon:yes gene_type:complete